MGALNTVPWRMLRRPLVPTIILAISLVAACDKGKSDDKKSGDKATAKKEDDKKEVKPEQAKPEEVKPEAKHFDVSADKSGTLARTAAVLETTDATSEDAALREHLAGISHHAEAMTSDEAMCTHIAELRKAEGQPEGQLESCVIHFEHEIVVLGPEVFAQMAQCVMDAKSVADIEVCEAAEKEAEQLIHEAKHGDSLSEEVCNSMVDKFAELAVADAGEHAELVKGVLADVKADSVQACIEHGSQAEVDCVEKAKVLGDLDSCQALL
jgi:hypothetical protein